MPPDNHFQHQTYSALAPQAPYELLSPTPPPPLGSDEFTDRMRAVGTALRASGVAAIYLVHGTFAGSDAWGLIREISRFVPSAREWMERLAKLTVDSVAKEQGNYTQRFADSFQSVINQEGKKPISVRMFTWTGENHHLGRADGAVRLLDELTQSSQFSEQRVLLWGHSHAGNVFALMTNLLGAQKRVRDQFFRAARSYFLYRRHDGDSSWWRMRKLLRAKGNPLAQAKLDIVTFGTPIRYGWETTAYNRLLHFVFHRPAVGHPEYQAKFPPTAEEVLEVVGGDYIQQLGIAGTNIQPGIFAWKTWLANRRLGNVLQKEVRRRDLIGNLKLGMRVPTEGTTVLVDYGKPDGHPGRHLAGHAVYTQPAWLLLHAEEVARRWYGYGG